MFHYLTFRIWVQSLPNQYGSPPPHHPNQSQSGLQIPHLHSYTQNSTKSSKCRLHYGNFRPLAVKSWIVGFCFFGKETILKTMLHIFIKFHYVTFGPSHKLLNTFWLTYFPQVTFTTSRPLVTELTSNTPGGVQVFPMGVRLFSNVVTE